MRFGVVEWSSVEPAAHQRAAGGEQEGRCNAELVRGHERSSLAPEQVARQYETPPRNFVDPTQHRLRLAGGRGKATAFNGREQIALEHHAARPAALDFARQGHLLYS